MCAQKKKGEKIEMKRENRKQGEITMCYGREVGGEENGVCVQDDGREDKQEDA